MSVNVGLYDLFAHIVPGGFYLFTVGYFCVVYRLVQVDFRLLNSLSATLVIAFATAAYFTAVALDPFARLWQHSFFGSERAPDAVLDEFKESHGNLLFRFRGRDWPILLALLRREKPDTVAYSIERHNASNIMLRNVSLNLMVPSIIQMVQYVRASLCVWNLVLCLAFVASSILVGRESERRKRWFYMSIYEAVVAGSLRFSDLLAPKPEAQSSVGAGGD